MSYHKFTHLDPLGNPWGVVAAEPLWADFYVLKYNRPENKLNYEDWMKLFTLGKSKAIDLGAQKIGVRVRQDYDSELFRKILELLEFTKVGWRIEYQQDVDKLPTETGTPIFWKTAAELNWSENEIAIFTEKIVINALDIDPNEKPIDFIQDWLNHPELTCGKDCISIGFLNDQPVALAVVQIEKKSGWSRISYMGVLPEFRGQGLGKWVHRHGFQKMKDQGGKLYHGGTHINNSAMKSLFEQHECQLFCIMEEFEWNAKRSTTHEA